MKAITASVDVVVHDIAAVPDPLAMFKRYSLCALMVVELDLLFPFVAVVPNIAPAVMALNASFAPKATPAKSKSVPVVVNEADVTDRPPDCTPVTLAPLLGSAQLAGLPENSSTDAQMFTLAPVTGMLMV